MSIIKMSLWQFFDKEAEPFNFFFANQCSLISNSNAIANKLEYLTQKCLSSVNLLVDDIAKNNSEFRPESRFI